MIRRVVAFLAAVAIGLTGAVTATSPAQAAWSDCGNYPGTVCLFANANWGTPIWRQYPSQITSYYNGCRNLDGFDNVTTVAANNTGGHYVITLWQLNGCTGESINIPLSGYSIDFSAAWWNDRASSIQATAL